MAASSKTTIAAVFNQAGTGKFPDNMAKQILAADMRAYVAVLLDSLAYLVDDAYSGFKGLKPGISTIAGLKAITVLNIPTGIFVTFRDTGNSDVLRVYELVSGTTAESSPNILRPVDYAGTTNEKIWKLAQLPSGGGTDHWKGSVTSAPTATLAGDEYYADADFTFGGFTIYEGTILTAIVNGASTYAQFLKTPSTK